MDLENRWFLAKYLEELKLESAGSSDSDFDFDLGRRRLLRWKSSPAFSAENIFEDFLKIQKLSEEELLKWLSIKTQIMDSTSWLEDILSGLENVQVEDPLLNKVLINGDPTAGFLFLIWPLVDKFKKQLLTGLALLKSPPFDLNLAADLLLEGLIPQLRRKLHRTLILEINVARLEGRLAGETPEDRFQVFVRSLNQPGVRRSLFSHYPVLARQLRDDLKNWQTASLEFLQRLTDDFVELEKKFGRLEFLKSIRSNMGDTHRHGRSVVVVEFLSGKNLVYKPRSLRLDNEFRAFVEWIQEKGLTPKLKTYRIWERADYGWCEFVSFEGCTEETEVEKFYERQGVWLALFYILGGTDLHLENVIACGENPVNIDLETLFHPHFLPAVANHSDELAMEQLSDSVLSIGLLPSPVHLENGKVMDKSGLGASRNQTLDFLVDGVSSLNSDEIRIVKVPGRIGEVHSSPILNGECVQPQSYRAFVKQGFASAYRFFLKHQAEIELRLEVFKNIPTRIVLRPSSNYGRLLSEGLHPKMNRNSLERELLFNQLWAETKLTPVYKSVVNSEVRQLLHGDIPYFMSTTDSRELTDGAGLKVSNFLYRSGWQIAYERVRRLGAEDLKAQLWLIDATYASVSKVSREGMRWSELRAAPIQTNKMTFLDAAIAAGEQLRASAIIHPSGTVSWVSLRYKLESEAEDIGHYNLGLIEDDLYSGLAGVIYFLAYLAAVAKDDSYRILARGGLKMLEARIASSPFYPVMGAFSGLAGFVYLYVHLAALWKDEDLLVQALNLLPNLEALINDDKNLDFIAGSAGAIPPLLMLATISNSQHALSLARKCGDKLLGASSVAGNMRSFPELRMPRGISHGHSGISLALTELASFSGGQKYFEAAVEIANHERSLLAASFWSDIPERPDAATWCHGAPGIALARLAMTKKFQRDDWSADATAAVQATLISPELENQILCHGSLGNLETLLASRLKNGVSEELISQKSDSILNAIQTRGWVSPLPAPVMEVGLMKGLAGIGYGFLRIAAEEQVPCVLTLQGPLVNETVYTLV